MSVYFIRDAVCGAIKIGVTRNPVRGRFSSLQVSSPHDLELLGYIEGEEDLESDLHFMLDAYRMRGEWFSCHPKVLETVYALLRDEHGEPCALHVYAKTLVPALLQSWGRGMYEAYDLDGDEAATMLERGAWAIEVRP